jgi:ParB family transcriptional regulator, chromosome partitioning protein
MSTTIRRLGRGLGGLLQRTEGTAPDAAPTAPPASSASPMSAPPAPRGAAPGTLPVEDIRPNPYQPRRVFDDGALSELKASIAEHGVLQPIVVRRAPGGYEVVAGERRLRAVTALGTSQIPAVVRDVDDAGMQTLALVENVQREDLNAIEKARALKAMMATQGLTQDEVAARVGKDRATIANLLRLLELPEEVRAMVEDGRLSGSQARAVLLAGGDANRTRLARMAAERGLSVRDVERLARLVSAKPSGKKATPVNPFVADIEDRLRRALSAKVTIDARRRGGTIHVEYADAAQLDGLLEKMGAQ